MPNDSQQPVAVFNVSAAGVDRPATAHREDSITTVGALEATARTANRAWQTSDETQTESSKRAGRPLQ
jgi:hypothetical protein